MSIQNPKFSGLTDDQVLQMLRRIATTADLMSGMCRDQAQLHGGEDVAYTFHALDTLLCGLGALADHATGGEIVGDFAAWMVGPYFDQVQQEGGAA